MISPELRAECRRLFFAEHWKVGTIASALRVHPDAVKNAIESERFKAWRGPRRSKLTPYVPFIRETLLQYPKLRASRLYEMIRERGYTGKSAGHVRRLVSSLRPAAATEAYLRLHVLPGEEGQVDWGSFGKVSIDGTVRPVSCFVMVLSSSRAVHAVFTLDQTLESFLRGHVEAFEYFGGVPRALLYDNLKSAVLERRGDAIRFHPRLLEFCGHYHFAPRPCRPGRGNEKGRVERAIQYLRTSFFAARQWRDVDDLNAQFKRWRECVAHQRHVPGRPGLRVFEALDQERKVLLPLPMHPFETDLVRVVRSGKTPYVRFDRNLYSIPHNKVRQSLTLVAGRDMVRILDGSSELARHRRSYGSGQVVEDPGHVAALVRQKRNAQGLKCRDRLAEAAPALNEFFATLAQRGEALGRHSARLLKLLDRYGADELRAAVDGAMSRGAYSAGCVAHILEQRHRASGLRPRMTVTLPDDPRVRNVHVVSHSLGSYDKLAGGDNDDNDNA